MPIYVFYCPACDTENEQLLPLGDTAPRPCPTESCQGTTKLRVSRVAVKYDTFGFNSTDKLLPNPTNRDLPALRRKAEEISDR